MVRFVSLLLVLVLASAAAAQDAVTGRLTGGPGAGAPLRLVRDPGGAATWGGLTGEADAPRHLLLERQGTGWVLVVRDSRPGARGVVGALEGEGSAPLWSWGPPRTIALEARAGRLVGEGVELADPGRVRPELPSPAELREAAADGALGRLIDRLEPDDLPDLASRVPDRATAAALVRTLLAEDGPRRRQAALALLDRARARGELEALTADLRQPPSPRVAALLAEAEQGRRPLVIGHRGLPGRECENTLPSLRAAIEAGASGVEIDLCVTRDGHVVLWHDAAPNDLVALVRNHGFEGGMAYMPVFADLGSRYRRPVHELTLAELRAHYGYARRRFTLHALDPDPRIEIPTLEEVAPFLAGAAALRRLFLDVKVPPAAQEAFGRAIGPVLARHGLTGRAVFMHEDAGVLGAVRAAIGDGADYTHDITINRLFGGGDPADYSAVRAARVMGNRVASIGRPRLMLWGGWDLYAGVLRHDRAWIDREGLELRLVAWTLNDADELREALAIGVDGVLTDDVALAVRLVRQAGLDRD